jgi:hypothetical protein
MRLRARYAQSPDISFVNRWVTGADLERAELTDDGVAEEQVVQEA